MSEDAKSLPRTEPDRVPLKWAARFFLSRDGIVTRADGRAVSALTLAQAQDYARRDIRFDPLREAKSRVPQGRHGDESLVFLSDGAKQVQLVRLMSPDERTLLHGYEPAGGMVASLCGHDVPAVGDTNFGWYFLRADDGAHWLFHGRSYASHLFAATQ